MVFNWFRRKFDSSAETDSTTEADQVIEETAVEPEDLAEQAVAPVTSPEKAAISKNNRLKLL
jgi:hypothetical protein